MVVRGRFFTFASTCAVIRRRSLIMGAVALIGSCGTAAAVTLSPQVQAEIKQLEGQIDGIENETLKRLATPPDNQVQQIELLGKLLLYDKELSVNRNQACAFCHMPEGDSPVRFPN